MVSYQLFIQSYLLNLSDHNLLGLYYILSMLYPLLIHPCCFLESKPLQFTPRHFGRLCSKLFIPQLCTEMTELWINDTGNPHIWEVLTQGARFSSGSGSDSAPLNRNISYIKFKTIVFHICLNALYNYKLYWSLAAYNREEC